MRPRRAHSTGKADVVTGPTSNSLLGKLHLQSSFSIIKSACILFIIHLIFRIMSLHEQWPRRMCLRRFRERVFKSRIDLIMTGARTEEFNRYLLTYLIPLSRRLFGYTSSPRRNYSVSRNPSFSCSNPKCQQTHLRSPSSSTSSELASTGAPRSRMSYIAELPSR